MHPQNKYCAGLQANNTLRKNYLTFNMEEVGKRFLGVFVKRPVGATLKKKRNNLHFII